MKGNDKKQTDRSSGHSMSLQNHSNIAAPSLAFCSTPVLQTCRESGIIYYVRPVFVAGQMSTFTVMTDMLLIRSAELGLRHASIYKSKLFNQNQFISVSSVPSLDLLVGAKSCQSFHTNKFSLVDQLQNVLTGDRPILGVFSMTGAIADLYSSDIKTKENHFWFHYSMCITI